MLDANQFFAGFALEMLRGALLELAADHLMNDAVGIRGRDGFGRNVLAIAQHGNRIT